MTFLNIFILDVFIRNLNEISGISSQSCSKEDSRDVLKKFCKAFQEEKRIYGQKILQQGDILKKMYVIYQGEVQVNRGFGDDRNKIDSEERNAIRSLSCSWE